MTLKERAKGLTESYEFGGTQDERLAKVEADLLALVQEATRQVLASIRERLDELEGEVTP